MKKNVILLFLILGIFGGGFFGYAWSQNKQQVIKRLEVPIERGILPTDSQAQAANPNTIQVPGVRISADIEPVGLDSENRMDTPKNVYNTGWYKLGIRPGERGSALIDGHFDTPTGDPSVFYQLNSVKIGDKILIKDDDAKEYSFTVYAVENYPVTAVPMGQLTEKTDEKRLHLITCGGKWDKASKTYLERTVVSARIAE